MTAAPTSARQPIRFAGSTAYLAMVSVVATGIASITGILLVLVIVFPLSILFPIWVPLIPKFFWNGAVLAAPVTLLLLPAVAALGRRHLMITYFVLPVAGLIGGALTMHLWSLARESLPEFFAWAQTHLWLDQAPLVLGKGSWFVGTFAGFVAGVFYSAAIREARR